MAEVTIRWSQTDTFESTVEVDLDEVVKWLRESSATSDITPEEVTGEQIREFWEAGDGEAEWWDPDANYDTDWQSVEDRTLEEVFL